MKYPWFWMLIYPQFLLHPYCNPFWKITHWLLSPYLPLFCTHLWSWGIRNSTQDPLTPTSSPGGSLPPSLGNSSPNCPTALLSPGQVATRWDQARPDYPPNCMGEQRLLHGRLLLFLANCSTSDFCFHFPLWGILFSTVFVSDSVILENIVLLFNKKHV